MQIATFENTKGDVAHFYQEGHICLYESQDQHWIQIKKIPLALKQEMGLMEVRSNLRAMTSDLGDCRTLIAAEIKGIPYTILEGMGFNLWKSSGAVEHQLNFIAQKERELLEKAHKTKPVPQPVGDIRDGIFRIHLSNVLAQNPTLTSKQILIPFLQNVTYDRLDILCDHAPRWIYKEASTLNIRSDFEDVENQDYNVKVSVYPA